MDQPASPEPPGGAWSDPHPHPHLLALLVESETILRIETADLLAEAGFEVLEAWSAPTAFRQIERHGAIRLVLADADLPCAEGRFALPREIAQRRPDLAVIALSSGPAPADGELPEGVRFAAKPLSASLARATRARLAE